LATAHLQQCDPVALQGSRSWNPSTCHGGQEMRRRPYSPRYPPCRPHPGHSQAEHQARTAGKAGTFVVRVSAPAGDFFLDNQDSRPLVLLSGGVGLTPILSMLDTLVAGAASGISGMSMPPCPAATMP
jgi:hypothetical protein